LKLAIVYTLGALLILAVFNALVFGLFVKDVPEHLETSVTEQLEERLENALYIADGLILFLVALFSYCMAGFVLKPIEKSYERQKKFVADAAHELRTPLAVMKTGAEAILSRNNDKVEYQKLTEDSLEEINYLSRLVDDLLIIAKSDNPQNPQLEKVSLSEIVHGQIDLMQSYAGQKEVTLKGDIEDGCYGDGSSVYLKRLMTNLIQNAIDYNKPNGKVFVSLRKKKQETELKVEDTGIGIAKEELPNIFNRFYKVDQARVQRSGGSGLGLSIAREIVKLHRGSIGVESELGKGTTITVTFPLAHS
jgi:signal transduction histidine kinase